MLSALFIQPGTSSSSSRRSIHSTYSVIVVGLFESIDARVVCDACDETSDSVFSRFFQYVTDIITPLTGFRRLILPSETQLSSYDSQDSSSMYDVSAGLHHYLRKLMEVDLVWKSKGLYLFQRYLPFTDVMSAFLAG